MVKDRQCVFWIGMILMFASGSCFADEGRIVTQSKALAHYIMGNIYDLNSDSRSALVEYQKSSKLDRQQPRPHLRIAAYDVRMGRLDEAVKHLKLVLKLHPESSQAHYLLALIYSSQKKYTLASSEYETILKMASDTDPENFEIHTYLAQLFYAQHKYVQAIEQVNQILQFQAKNVSALFLLGAIYLDSGEKEKAKENFRKVLALEPDHDESLNSLAYVYAEEGVNLDEAFKMAKRAVELDPANGAYHDTLGWVLFKKGLNTQALMALQRALNYVTDPVIYEHIGEVYQTTGEPSLARKFWLKSLELDPDQPKLSQKLDLLNKRTAKIQESIPLSTK